MSSSLQEEILELINELQVTTVLVESKDEKGIIPSVTIDNELATYESTKYLIGKQNKDIAFIGVHKDGANAWSDRFTGYEKAIKESGLKLNEDIIYFDDLRPRSGYEGIKAMLEKG